MNRSEKDAVNETFSDTQIRRLKELGAAPEEYRTGFDDVCDRDRAFQEAERRHVQDERLRLAEFRDGVRRPRLCTLENDLAEMLAAEGFVQVATPIIMTRTMLSKMGIGDDHPLVSQVFWLNHKQCLRPMLAPHLYSIARDLLRLWPDQPVRLFEIGPCFRKESQGAQHSNEFTMLNLAEFGLPEDRRHDRIREMAGLVLREAGIADIRFTEERSEVYGDTIDIVAGGIVAGDEQMELGSSAMGPHPLDAFWRITTTWVGIGFGLERLIMAAGGHGGMGRTARSLTYLNGIRLNI